MLTSLPIAALFNGVSQQPAPLRLTSQCEDQVNYFGTIVRGLIKRPPTVHRARITTTNVGAAFIHTINRSVTERYAVIITGGVIRVFDALTGIEKTVGTPDGLGYLASSSPLDDFAAITIADYTVIVNKTKVVAMDTGLLSPGSISGTVQTFADLPPTPGVGNIYEIAGDPANQFDSYYMVRDGSVWKETVKPGIVVAFDATTMPYRLVRNSDGTFTFQKAVWGERKAGNLDSAPPPSFVGKTISDIFFHKNRLGFVADENAILSEVGEFFNFWPTTVTDLLPTDTIDEAAGGSQVAILKHAVAFNKSLMLFSDKQQFALSAGDGGLTSGTTVIDETTSFETSSRCKPIGVGNSLFFITEGDKYSALREYFVDGVTLTNDATDVSAHVPNFLPKNIRKLAASTNYDTVFALSTDTPNLLYVYRWFWRGNEKVQSSWGKIEFDASDAVLDMEMVGSQLYLTIQRTDGVYFDTMDIELGRVAYDLGYEIYLDRRCEITGTYDSLNNRTVFALPYSEPVDSPMRVVLGSAFTGSAGALVNPTTYTRPDEFTLYVSGNYSAGPAIVGRNYTATYTFSEQFFKDSSGNSVLEGRMQLRYVTVSYIDTAYFKTSVETPGRDAMLLTVVPAKLSLFTGKTLGDTALIGVPSFASGEYRFPAFGSSKTAQVSLVNDSYLASNFQSAEFEAFFQTRHQVR